MTYVENAIPRFEKLAERAAHFYGATTATVSDKLNQIAVERLREASYAITMSLLAEQGEKDIDSEKILLGGTKKVITFRAYNDADIGGKMISEFELVEHDSGLFDEPRRDTKIWFPHLHPSIDNIEGSVSLIDPDYLGGSAHVPLQSVDIRRVASSAKAAVNVLRKQPAQL